MATLPTVTLDDISAARAALGDLIRPTPLEYSRTLSEKVGTQVYLKCENLQRAGSFKIRGAYTRLARLSEEEKERGVVAASAGNHALGLAYHGKLLGVPVTVVMPDYAPLIKITTCEKLGARVVVQGNDFTAARAIADELVAREGLTYIHGFDAADIIAGQGTLGLEILRQVPDVEAILVPVGGAGLIAGVAVAVKALRPDVQVIGIESTHTGNFAAALRAGRPVTVRRRPTLADGLAPLIVGPTSFALARDRVDRVVSVSEPFIALAILRLLELEKTVVEGAAAVPLAALMADKLPELRGRRVALILSGGNIDPAILGRVIDKGLVHDGRLARFTTVVHDRPGGLAALTRVIADSGASIRDIVHERAFGGPDVFAVHAICTVETRDHAHVAALRRALRKQGFPTTAARDR